MFKGKIDDVEITFEPTGDFDGILTISCPKCEAPKSMRLSDLNPDELVSCACGGRQVNPESFRQTIREEVIKVAQDAFKGLLK